MGDDAAEGHDYADDGSRYTEGEGGAASFDTTAGTTWDGIEHLGNAVGDFYGVYGHAAAAGFDAFMGDMAGAQHHNNEAIQDAHDAEAEGQQASQDLLGD